MRTPRLAGLSLALMATATLALGGCTADDAPGTAGLASSAPAATASSRAADPAAAATLAKAAAALDDTSFKITITSGPGLSVVGLLDAPHGVGTGTLEVTGKRAGLQVKSLVVGPDLYVQIRGVTTADTWMHVDAKRLPANTNLSVRPGQLDPANTARLITATTDVQQVDARSYRGALDLTKVAGVTGIDKVTVDIWGAAAQHVPFTAGLDAQGRLSVLTLELPAVAGQPARPLEVLYTDYGTKVSAAKPPASKVTEAPESIYPGLGS